MKLKKQLKSPDKAAFYKQQWEAAEIKLTAANNALVEKDSLLKSNDVLIEQLKSNNALMEQMKSDTQSKSKKKRRKRG